MEGRYRVLKLLGEGGMGTVFLAEHQLIKRKVAIKVLRPQFASDTTVVERFMNEARAAGTLGHPNIVESTDMGFIEGNVPYIVFEYLEGSLLTDEIYRVGGLPYRRAVRIAEQVAAALRAAHDAGIVHRDLKSENVFLTDKDDLNDHVKVLDFGISRFLEVDDKHRSMVMGTPEFMAPEQFTDPEHVDGRADIYALGVILYEMLGARRPFAGGNGLELQRRIISEAPSPIGRSDSPAGLQDLIVNRLLAKSPADRPQSMGEVQQLLEQFLTRADGTPIPVPRRKTQPSSEPATKVPDARNSDTIPRPQGMRLTPFPVGEVNAPDTKAKRPIAIYAIAGASVVVGALGITFGLRSASSPQPAAAPAVQPAPAAAIAAPAPTPKEPTKIAVELESDVANARVTFRRRLAAAPFKGDVSPTDVVELVEFSATGYKTERYWVTFDRATHLKAHLVKGSGLEEASEEATLVALGELDPTSAAKPAAKPAVAAAVAKATPAAEPAVAKSAPATSTHDQPTATVATRRKIGRSAETTETPVAQATKPAAEPEPAIVAQAPTPKAEPTPAPPPAPAPAPTKVAVATPPAPMAAAVPEPVAVTPQPPKTELAHVVQNAQPAVAVQAVAPKNIAPATFTALRASGSAIEPPEIVQTQMVRDEKTKASAVIKVCIDANGAVTSASAAKSSGYAAYDQRLIEGVHSWRYRPYMENGKAVPACSAVVFAFKLQ